MDSTATATCGRGSDALRAAAADSRLPRHRPIYHFHVAPAYHGCVLSPCNMLDNVRTALVAVFFLLAGCSTPSPRSSEKKAGGPPEDHPTTSASKHPLPKGLELSGHTLAASAHAQ